MSEEEQAGAVVEWGVLYPGEDEPRLAPGEWDAANWISVWNANREGQDEAVLMRREVTATPWTVAPTATTAGERGSE